MALGQRRMLTTKMFQNPAVAQLCDKAFKLYVGLIAHADDDGRLRADSLLLRSLVFPYDEKITQEDIRRLIAEIKNVDKKDPLVDFYSVNKQWFIQHPNWNKYQSIRKDLYKPSTYPPNPLRKRNEDVTKSHPNISKDKISKESKDLAREYLIKIPEVDLEKFHKRFDVSKKQLISKGEQLYNYCKMHGKYYKDYYFMMLNALKGDFPEREKPPAQTNTAPPKPKEEDVPDTPEEREKRKKAIEKMRGELQELGVLKKAKL